MLRPYTQRGKYLPDVLTSGSFSCKDKNGMAQPHGKLHIWFFERPHTDFQVVDKGGSFLASLPESVAYSSSR